MAIYLSEKCKIFRFISRVSQIICIFAAENQYNKWYAEIYMQKYRQDT